MSVTDRAELADDISVLLSDDGSWPDMPIIDEEDSSQFGKSSTDTSPAASLAGEPYHYTLLPDAQHDKVSHRLQCLLTPPTPVAQENPTPAFVDMPPTRTTRYESDSDSVDMPLPSPVQFQSKWIHRRLWAREDTQGDNRRNSLLGTVMPRSWSRDRAARNRSLSCEKSTADRHVVAIHPPALTRSSSLSPSIASSLASSSSRAARKPAKSALSSRTSISTKASKMTRSGSGSAPSVKFADSPTYYYDCEYKYTHGHEHHAISEYDVAFYSPPTSPAVSSAVPCLGTPPPPRKSAAAATAAHANKVRQALQRLLPTAPRRTVGQNRPSVASISGPYPLWKDNDGASVRSGRSIPSSVQSAPASRGKVKTFWGRMVACTI